tara:strand:- start:15 stop:473 length:459 start_codon:yes stop_codon:yes gene_type:complete
VKDKQYIVTTNKKAFFSYTLSDFFICGIQLKGSEIKSIRSKDVNISDAYCIIEQNEIIIKNIDIAKYKFCQEELYRPKRDRKLLLTKNEIKKIKRNLDQKGMTLIPTKLIINERGLAKIEVSLAKGKKTHDKRESIKERDAKREIDRKKREK